MKHITLLKFILMSLVAAGHATCSGQPDSTNVRVFNRGNYYINKYIISVGNQDYEFNNIAIGEYSDYVKLPFIWSYNRTEITILVKRKFKKEKLITMTLRPLDHEGDTKYTNGKFAILVLTKHYKKQYILNAFVKKE